MTIEELIHVSGLPGLYKIGATRSNGIIIEDIDSGKSKFASMRKHQFTPLGTVAVYTNSDAAELTVVFQSMYDKETNLTVPNPKGGARELFEYFEEILPDYDRDQVLISDVKKLIKWYQFLRKRNLFPFDAKSSEEE